MSFKCVPIYGLMFRILTRFHALYFGASCIHRNSIVWRRVNLARFPYWPEKRKRTISRYSYLMKTLISSEYGLTISGHVTVLRQWVSEKNTDYIIINDISVIYVTARRCAGGLKKKLDLRSGSQRHRHFVGFFNVPVQAPTRDHPFYTVIPTHRPN